VADLGLEALRVASADPLAELRRVLESELHQSGTAADLLARLQALRSELRGESRDDVPVGMDWLVGSCSPHQRLTDGPSSRARRSA
jgi:hypothetical protein